MIGVSDQDAPRRAELAAFLRARRAALQPGDVGLPDAATGRRRTPGLRREEVAQLAGVGLAWYTWLEQGRVLATSTQVIDALARALRLNDQEHRHLRALANLPLPPRPVQSSTPEPLRRMVDNLLPNPAYLIDQRFDFLVWNRAYTRVWRDLTEVPEPQRNLIWLFFTDPDLPDLVVDWTQRASMLLAQFRAVVGRHAGDHRLTELVDELTQASPTFRQWWPSYPVGGPGAPHHTIRHPEAGEIRFDLAQLRLDRHPGLTLVLQTPLTPTDRDALTALLTAHPAPGAAGELAGRPRRALDDRRDHR